MLAERSSRRIFWVEAVMFVLPMVLVCGYGGAIICAIAVADTVRLGVASLNGVLLLFGAIGLLACISGAYLSWVFLRSGSLALAALRWYWWAFAYSGLVCTFLLFPSLSHLFYPAPNLLSQVQRVLLTGILAIVPPLHLTLERLLRRPDHIPA